MRPQVIGMNLEKFTALAQQILAASQRLAEAQKNPAVEETHLLKALLSEAAPIEALLKKLNLYAGAERLANAQLKTLPVVASLNPANMTISGSLGRLIQSAPDEAKKWGDAFVTVEHLFVGLLDPTTSLSAPLKQLGFVKQNLVEEFKKMRGSQKADDANAEEKYQTLEKYSKDLTALAKEGRLDPVIGRDDEIRRVIQVLSRRTKNNPVLIGEPGVGKTAIAEGLAQRIIKGDIPESLKGKKVLSMDLGAMVAGAKYRGEFEERLKSFIKEVQASHGEIILFIDEIHTLVGAGKTDGAMDAGNLLKPALARGELRCVGATTLDEYRKNIEKDPALERRFQQVYVGEPTIEESISILRGLKEKFEVHHGVRIQDQALVAAATLSNRYIADRFLPDKAIDLVDEAAAKLRIEIDSMPQDIDEKVRALTQKEIECVALRKETDPASKQRLSDIENLIASEKDAVEKLKARWNAEKQIIQKQRTLKEDYEKLQLELEQAQRASNLQRAAEIKYGKLPDLQKSIENIQKELQAGPNDRMLKEEVSADDIAGIVAKWTGIPVDRLLKGENEKLLKLETSLKKRVKGQDAALQSVADSVRMARSGLKDPSKPIGSFLFLGPTGVGKTETARALAEFMFDDEQSMVRVDMSEYMEKHSVARLIGAPPGYVGHDEGGQLTEAVRRRPYNVLLLDEIEKAHPDVLNILLQIMDDGRLTDGQGRVVDFKNVVLIMTSNLGSHLILEEGVQDKAATSRKIMDFIKTQMRPEFINRIDDIVIFNSLDKTLIREIVDVQIERVNRLVAERKLHLSLTDRAKDFLAAAGYDPTYGARPLKRAIHKHLQVPLSKKLLEGVFMDGEQILIDVGINADTAEKELSFKGHATA